MSAHPDVAASERGTDETIVPRGNFLPNGRGTPTGNGWTWLARAWSIFRPAAGLWIGMTLTLAVILIVLGVIPVIGPIALSVLWPVFVAGVMIVSRTIEHAGEPQFSQLFAGFKVRFGTLIALGVIELVLSFLIVAAVVALTGVKVYGLMSPEANAEQVFAAAATVALAGLIMLALMLPLVMATWFAPALIVFNELGAWSAMKASFVGCLKNVLPFLLYGVIGLVAGAIASVPLLLGWLVLAPVLAASVYTSYRDIYFEPGA